MIVSLHLSTYSDVRCWSHVADGDHDGQQLAEEEAQRVLAELVVGAVAEVGQQRRVLGGGILHHPAHNTGGAVHIGHLSSGVPVQAARH